MRVDAAADRSFEQGDPVCAYWLANCERFDVRSGRRTGTVERVELDGARRPRSLDVRFGFRRAVVPAAEVQAVVPAKRLIVVEGSPREPRVSPALASASGRVARVGRVAAGTAGRAVHAAAAWVAVALALVAQVVYARGRVAVATLRARRAEAMRRRHSPPRRRQQRRMQPR